MTFRPGATANRRWLPGGRRRRSTRPVFYVTSRRTNARNHASSSTAPSRTGRRVPRRCRKR